MNRLAMKKGQNLSQGGGKLKLRKNTLARLRGSGFGQSPVEGRGSIGRSFTGTISIITAVKDNVANQYTDGGKLSNAVSCLYTCA